jgi:hypothetical protein
MTALADRIDVQLEKPRTAIRIKHRSTAGDVNDTACRYFKVNVFSLHVLLNSRRDFQKTNLPCFLHLN